MKVITRCKAQCIQFTLCYARKMKVDFLLFFSDGCYLTSHASFPRVGLLETLFSVSWDDSKNMSSFLQKLQFAWSFLFYFYFFVSSLFYFESGLIKQLDMSREAFGYRLVLLNLDRPNTSQEMSSICVSRIPFLVNKAESFLFSLEIEKWIDFSSTNTIRNTN